MICLEHIFLFWSSNSPDPPLLSLHGGGGHVMWPITLKYKVFHTT